jgi:putative hydrolase of the HAD superfamily
VDAVVFCVDVGWRKPHQAPFSRALSALGVTASEAIFVGDDPQWDMVGARNAGIRPVLLGPDGSGEHHTIENLREVLALVTQDSESSNTT